MRKIVFIFSCMSILIGAITIIITSILNEVIAKLGRMAFQVAAAGSYSSSDYEMNFYLTNLIAVVAIIAGIVVSVKMYNETKDK